MNPQIFDFISSSLLLDPSIRGDLPMPLYKTASQILEENLFSLIIFLIVLLFIVIIWLYLRKRNSGTTDKEEPVTCDPFQDAVDAIHGLKNQTNLEPKPLVFKLSEILRNYIQQIFLLPAMELTGEEFMKEISSHSFFQNRFEDTLSEFIKRGDFIKYSDDHCTSQATDQLLEIALNFVKNTNTELKAKQDNIENLPREDAKTRQSL